MGNPARQAGGGTQGASGVPVNSPAFPTSPPRHLAIFEPRVEGHHLMVLRLLVEGFLAANLRLTLALDHSSTAQNRWREHLSPWLGKVQTIPISPRKRWSTNDVSEVLVRSGADEIFMGSVDELGSSSLRRAALGWMPDKTLRGRWSGIYHRPRFLAAGRSPNHRLKRAGFARLVGNGWFHRLFLFDEYLCAESNAMWPDAPLFPLCLPCSNTFTTSQTEARARLKIPANRTVFLFYGGGYRRKGLPLAIEAMLGLPPEFPAFLLCAGQQPPGGDIEAGLAQLTTRGQALALNRFVSSEEEELCFGACDVALLPYRGHFGTSGVMAQAIHAGKPIVASDEQLIGRRVRERGLGWLFPPGDVVAFRETLRSATLANAEKRRSLTEAVARYAATCTRAAFQSALFNAYNLGMKTTNEHE